MPSPDKLSDYYGRKLTKIYKDYHMNLVYLTPDEVRLAQYYDMFNYLFWDEEVMLYYLNPTVSITSFYNIMVERAFLANKNTMWDEALRKIIQGMKDFTIKRGTPEFDAVFDEINSIRGESNYYD